MEGEGIWRGGGTCREGVCGGGGGGVRFPVRTAAS